jgi:integrase
VASIANDPGGRRRILFVAPGGERKTIRLGKVSGRAAESFKYRVEQLLECQLLKRPMAADLAQWISDLDDSLARKLAGVGLIPNQEPPPLTTLEPFLTEYIAGRSDVKRGTREHLERAKHDLIRYFGAERALTAITPGDADDFRLHLLSRLADNTVRRRCGRAKQFFRAALRKRLISENPFGDMKGCCVQANRNRDYFISREEADLVIAASPDAEWRLIFALSRFGGLRCPSEHLSLTWADVDWERDRIRVRSPKTEHHDGGDSRLIPIFPELRPHLEQVWEEAAPGTEYVITRYRSANSNLRTQLERIIHKAGLKPWPKLFHNLRATRETELAQSFPLHVVCAWIGNSKAIAAKHYLQVTDDHFRAATEQPSPAGAAPQVAQNPAQQAHARDRTDSQGETADCEKPRSLRGIATRYDSTQLLETPPVGLEPKLFALGTHGDNVAIAS